MHQKSDLSKTVDVVGAATRSPHQLVGRIYTSKLQEESPPIQRDFIKGQHIY